VLGSIYFDPDGQLRMFQDLLNSGAVQLLTDQLVQSESSSRHNTNTTTTYRSLSTSTSSSLNTSLVLQIKEVHFLGVHILGWLIKFKHTQGLRMFLERGFDASADEVDQSGSPCLHFIAQYGTAEMVNVVFEISPNCRLEQLNRLGETCGMVAAKYGNFAVAKRLFALFASARKSLQGKYAAWVLAFVRRQEKNERSTQTGVIGDDDERYFCVAPDPMYSMWYYI